MEKQLHLLVFGLVYLMASISIHKSTENYKLTIL